MGVLESAPYALMKRPCAHACVHRGAWSAAWVCRVRPPMCLISIEGCWMGPWYAHLEYVSAWVGVWAVCIEAHTICPEVHLTKVGCAKEGHAWGPAQGAYVCALCALRCDKRGCLGVCDDYPIWRILQGQSVCAGCFPGVPSVCTLGALGAPLGCPAYAYGMR